MNNKEIEKELIRLSEKEYREFHLRLCITKKEVLGVRLPLLRELAKKIAKDNWREYLDNAKDDYYEEVMLQGLVLNYVKTDIKEIYMYLDKFIPKIDNWAICDSVCNGLKIFNKNREETWEYLKKYLNSDKEFELRFAIIILMKTYLTDTYIDDVLRILNNISNEGYYVKMGVAWVIAEAYTRFPDKTMRLLKNNKLDDFTYNKSLQKIIESYRIDNETKDKMRKMKRVK